MGWSQEGSRRRRTDEKGRKVAEREHKSFPPCNYSFGHIVSSVCTTVVLSMSSVAIIFS